MLYIVLEINGESPLQYNIINYIAILNKVNIAIYQVLCII